MPRLTVTKEIVLVDDVGDIHRLETHSKFEEACQKVNLDPERFHLEQRDLMELQP